MILGIVSKPDHAKNHAAALESDGHIVRLLGSDPVDFPQDLEVMVLRHLSSSHGGLDRARAYAKARRIPIVAENGLSGIRMAIDAMGNKYIREMTMGEPNTEGAKMEQIEVDDDSAIAEAIKSGKVNSFVKQLLSPYAKLPARFLYRCMNAFSISELPTEAKFADFFKKLNPNEDIQEKAFNAFYSAGFKILNLSTTERGIIRDAFMNGDMGGSSFYPSPMPPVLDSLRGRSNAFLSFYMWLLADSRPKRASMILNSYAELSGVRQADPKAFAKYRDAFGFEMTMAREKAEASEIEVAEVTKPEVVEVKKASVVQDTILKTVQDEILNLAIRLEEFDKLTKRIDTIDNGLGSTNNAITKIEAALRDVNQSVQHAAKDKGTPATLIDEKFKKASQEYQNLANYLNVVRNDQSEMTKAISSLQSNVIDLAEQVKVLVERVKNPTVSESSSVENALRTLKAMGATVTITLPA
jgi:methyl-accepting chemotaxis protein